MTENGCGTAKISAFYAKTFRFSNTVNNFGYWEGASHTNYIYGLYISI